MTFELFYRHFSLTELRQHFVDVHDVLATSLRIDDHFIDVIKTFLFLLFKYYNILRTLKRSRCFAKAKTQASTRISTNLREIFGFVLGIVFDWLF